MPILNLSNIFLLSSCGLLGLGYYHLRRHKFLQQIFQQIQRINQFNIDYINNIQDLPLKKQILLVGVVQPSDYILKTLNNKEAVFISYLKQNKNDEDERLWNSNNIMRFLLLHNNGSRILIQSSQKIFLYNLQKTGEVDSNFKKLNGSVLNKIYSLFNKKIKYNQYSIVTGNNIVMIGTLYKNQSIQDQNNIKSGNENTNVNHQIPHNYKFKPQFLLGQNNQAFVKYLDNRLVKQSKIWKNCIKVGSGMLIGHALFKRISYWLMDRDTVQLPKLNSQINLK